MLVLERAKEDTMLRTPHQKRGAADRGYDAYDRSDYGYALCDGYDERLAARVRRREPDRAVVRRLVARRMEPRAHACT